jgi:hypothetical protein
MFQRKGAKYPGLTTVRVAQGLLQAEIYKSKLESAGIPALLEYESLGPTLGITVDGLGQVRVMVHDDLADEARALLEEREMGEEEESQEREEDL